MQHISTSERMLRASYTKKEEEIKELRRRISELELQLELTQNRVIEYRELNNILTNQISFLSSYKSHV